MQIIKYLRITVLIILKALINHLDSEVTECMAITINKSSVN